MNPPLENRRLYLCTPDRPDLTTFVESCIRGGVDIVQLREKHLDARPLLRRAREIQRVCLDFDVPFVMNDRPDLALEIGADGVHVGQDDAPPQLARRILGEGAIIGLSTHAPGDLLRLSDAPVDYISAGPVVPTPTKPGRPGTGTDYLTLAIKSSPVPVFVTGGVSQDSVPGLVEIGVRHFVVVRWLTESSDPQRTARTLRQAIERGIDIAESRKTTGI